MNMKQKIMAAVVGLVVMVVIGWYLLPSGGEEGDKDVQTPTDGGAGQGIDKEAVQQVDEKAISERVANLQRLTKAKDADVQELLKGMQDLLDEDDEDGAFELAKTFSKSPSKELKSRALDTFRWIGGKRSALACREMLSDNDEDIAKEAMEAFRQSLESIEEEEGYSDLYPMIEDVIMACKDENDLSGLFLLLSNLDIHDSLNLYMDLQEKAKKEDRADLVDMTKEYIEFVTNGDESIDSRTAMEKWLKQHDEEEKE
ncbi:MAG: hypothetical protein K5787_18495 [Lentisphaeria bacterium]|nr:hypothetical protein [Lentisphaeria bacterium]